MIYWAPLLHFYQPPTQTYQILAKVCHESYRPLVKLLHDSSQAKVTVNIIASLTEMLEEHGMSDVIYGLCNLAQKGRAEFVSSAQYHPVLPLIPQDEMLRQIVLNHRTNRHYFGESYKPQGFFSPEMCYSHDIVKPIIETEHKWLILAGVACPVEWPTTLIHEIHVGGEKLSVFFRDDLLSNKIAFGEMDVSGFFGSLKRLANNAKDIYVITAMDGETFGHHIKNWDKLFLEEAYKTIAYEAEGTSEPLNIKVVTVSELFRLFPQGKAVEPRPSSWSTSPDDIQAGNPYPLWNSKDNPIHQLQWQHLKIATFLAHKANEVATTQPARNFADLARGLLDQAVHSDQFWWASRKPWWDINMVNRGLMKQAEVVLNAYQAIKMSRLSEDEKAQCYYQFITAGELRNKVTDHLLS